MSRVVEHLAELTGFRDRDLLDVTLVGALKDLLRPIGAAIYRRVGEPDAERWLTRARVGPGDKVATADSVWADIESLPSLGDEPARLACLRRQEAFLVPGAPAAAYFPLVDDDDVPGGVLEIHSEAALTPDDVRLVSSILRVYRNFKALLDYSERDTLTGLLNRKTFDGSFLRIAARGLEPIQDLPEGALDHQRQAGRTWLGVIDIDHFKSVNDRHGHLIGDEVLLLLARLMRCTFRCDDHLYRFGGEEFVVLMRCRNATDATAAFERLRRSASEYPFPQVGRITVSAGFTELRPGDTPGAAFERADNAMYYAKQHGRDQVLDYATLVADGRLVDTQRASEVELFLGDPPSSPPA
ncbi:GGDEF domain-containing protein [Rubrivivax sp. A210]|uniref:GGDEF domain-containing protein n=1 Tax=Rubrivivax sp. A210 TaxID=2772301 RepID=UPI0019188DF8|nr:GGDEF domain-containing protein [Rubrivivax sp. A210]CAD5375284.1 GGDEF domain-containing protein [Rubrivivax sp. A210]